MTSDQQSAIWTRVAREHEENPHPGVVGGRLRVHLAVHVVVETQLEQGEPAEVARTLDRLALEGMTRHQAIHAVGQVASEEVIACLARGERYDEERYVARLRQLSADAVQQPEQAP